MKMNQVIPKDIQDATNQKYPMPPIDESGAMIY